MLFWVPVSQTIDIYKRLIQVSSVYAMHLKFTTRSNLEVGWGVNMNHALRDAEVQMGRLQEQA